MKKNILPGIILLFSLLSCSERINIEKLEHKELVFQQLPLTVQEALKDPIKFGIKIVEIDRGLTTTNMKSLVVLDNKKKYEFETVSTGSWVDYRLIKDPINKQSYKINRNDNPRPYIIYLGKLYIPKEYNIFTGDTWYTTKYTEYILK